MLAHLAVRTYNSCVSEGKLSAHCLMTSALVLNRSLKNNGVEVATGGSSTCGTGFEEEHLSGRLTGVRASPQQPFKKRQLKSSHLCLPPATQNSHRDNRDEDSFQKNAAHLVFPSINTHRLSCVTAEVLK